MAYITVTATFPETTTEQREAIFLHLTDMKWILLESFSNAQTTKWKGFFHDSLPEDIAKIGAIRSFEKGYREVMGNNSLKPKLITHWGPNEPTVYD